MTVDEMCDVFAGEIRELVDADVHTDLVLAPPSVTVSLITHAEPRQYARGSLDLFYLWDADVRAEFARGITGAIAAARRA